jgi:ABC-type transport system involved in multi-copper enzyme maturation permease subunit
MVSRSLEKMMLIAIGLSTVVIIGVPVLMFAIETINTTSELQEVVLVAEQIHNATRDVDTGILNTTAITFWVNPSVTVAATGKTLTVLFNDDGEPPKTWSASYNHDIIIDDPILAHSDRVLYSAEFALVGDVIHISFLEVPI